MAKSEAMVVTRPGHMEMQEFDLPETGAEDGLLKVELVGVCGSDPKIFLGKPSRGTRPFPLILGHEIVGRVHQMGEGARKRHGVQEGDRVIVEYAFGCGECRPCLAGRYHTLRQNVFLWLDDLVPEPTSSVWSLFPIPVHSPPSNGP